MNNIQTMKTMDNFVENIIFRYRIVFFFLKKDEIFKIEVERYTKNTLLIRCKGLNKIIYS